MDIVEKVAKAIWGVDSDPGCKWQSCSDEARAAIKATLEHLRDNVSEGMRFEAETAYTDARYDDYEDGLLVYYRAMINQAMKEIK